MTSSVAAVLYVAAMIAVIVTTDVLFWRRNFTLRLIGNISIVLLFGFGYFLLFR